MSAGRSLEIRAIAWLAQREHSRVELRAKLLRAAAATRAGGAMTDPAPAVEAMLDRLEALGHLSQERFAESRVRMRAPRHGTERIRRELRQHGVALAPDALAALHASEYERARQVWQRRFGAPAVDDAGRARQARFLAARGFSTEVVRRLLRSGDEGD